MKKNFSNTIVGSGFIANNLNKYKELFERLNICVYAAGVSNSLCANNDLFERDKRRLFDFKKQVDKNQILLYFSTCSLDDPSRNKNPYVKNKLIIEKFIEKNFKKYLIIRLPEVIGYNKNTNTLINFLYDKIKKNQIFNLWRRASRSVIDIDDVVTILIDLVSEKKYENRIINIANPKKYLVIEIVNMIEQITKKKAKYKLVDKGESNWIIDLSPILESIKRHKINFDDKYLKNVLKKYVI